MAKSSTRKKWIKVTTLDLIKILKGGITITRRNSRSYKKGNILGMSIEQGVSFENFGKLEVVDVKYKENITVLKLKLVDICPGIMIGKKERDY